MTKLPSVGKTSGRKNIAYAAMPSIGCFLYTFVTDCEAVKHGVLLCVEAVWRDIVPCKVP